MPEDYALTRPLLRDWKTVDQGIADHVAEPDPHEQYATDQDLADHVADPDPHEQYALETAALSAFAYAAYGGVHYDGNPYDFPNLGGGWQDLDFMASQSIATPRGFVVNTANSSLQPLQAGVYMLSAALSFDHNSSNGGRLTRVRLYNQTDGAPMGDGFQVGTGRNAEATAVGISMLFEISEAEAGNEIIAQIGGGDSYTSVEFTAAAYSMHSVGEFRGQLPGAG